MENPPLWRSWAECSDKSRSDDPRGVAPTAGDNAHLRGAGGVGAGTASVAGVRAMVDQGLTALDAEFQALYSHTGRPSISPEYLLRATLLQILYSVRPERMLIEQIDYNLMFRWFIGLSMDDSVMGSRHLHQEPGPAAGSAYRPAFLTRGG